MRHYDTYDNRHRRGGVLPRQLHPRRMRFDKKVRPSVGVIEKPVSNVTFLAVDMESLAIALDDNLKYVSSQFPYSVEIIVTRELCQIITSHFTSLGDITFFILLGLG